MKPRYSKLHVTPSDYLTGGVELLLKAWQISYYYFDNEHLKGVQIRIKGMNGENTLEKRRNITKNLIANEVKHLDRGYNPITKVYTDNIQEVNENTLFIAALEKALELLIAEHSTKLDIKSTIKRIKRHAEALDLVLTPVSEVRKRDIVLLLDRCFKVDNLTANRYNVTKRYLSILYRVLTKYEAVEHNFIKDIENMRGVQKVRTVITTDERTKLKELKQINYEFFRLIEIFFNSGARITELLRLQIKDVDFNKQEFKVLIKKGSYAKENIKPISGNVLHYWSELITNKDPEYFVFSTGLIPGKNQIRTDKITRRWKLWCKNEKKGLGIKSDMYSLKHARLDEVAKIKGLQYSSDLAGHMSSKITMVYATQEKQRRLNEMKELKINL